ncbi:hypothetical protein APHAL10511_004372 [Amanita phalloides]|nr:hypothetical protein APHAL10511_004372 [Amanita phalloides]
MSSFDKTVKLACKPKAAPPKPKYLDPIIAATWGDEGAVSDVCKALSPRFREPNAIVVFKALIVLHTMMRNGSTDNVLSYLSSSDVLRLRNVSTGNWDGYAAPKNLQHYAIYLDSRIRAYRELKHDAIRVQAENNRDLRNSLSIEEDVQRNIKEKERTKGNTNNGPQRSKTLMGRKLRSMTVEKGLLRETRIVQKMIDALVECRFYLDDLEDELTNTALRMLVKDLLILIQACNEGVINVLEHYFEMSHTDAKQALEIYRHFCKQTDFVDEYLGVARKLQNLLNVPIPNFKHAPVSLAGALQEYLEDPNFEQNRIEYKAAKAAAERNGKNPVPKMKPRENESQRKPVEAGTSVAASIAIDPKNTTQDSQNMIDFFATIEEPSSPYSNSPPFATGPHNPFSHMAFGNQPMGQFAIQPTGQVFHQQTSVPNPFGMQNVSQPPGHQPFSSFLPSQLPQQGTGLFAQEIQQQPTQVNPFSQDAGLLQMPQQPQPNPFSQATGSPQSQQQSQPNPFSQLQGTVLNQQQSHLGPFSETQPNPFSQLHLRSQPSGFLQSQATGANPFRQSTLLLQTTGMAMFGVGSPTGQGPSNPFGSLNAQNTRTFVQSQSTGVISSIPSSASASGFTSGASFEQQNIPPNLPARPASTPSTLPGQNPSSASPPQAQPVQSHQTGSRNPFGPITKTPPPMPKAPTLMELAMGFHNNQQTSASSTITAQQQLSSLQSVPAANSFSFNSGALSPGTIDMSSIASSFTFNNVHSANGGPGHTIEPSHLTDSPTSSLFSSALSTQPTSAASASSGTSHLNTASLQPLKSHLTGFAGLKPFKPTSSFGTALLESLPPIPDDVAAQSNNNAQYSSTSPTASPSGTLGSLSQPNGGFGGFRPAGLTSGQGLRPQMTGGGASNPFRASMLSPTMTGIPNVPNLPSPTTGGGIGAQSPFAKLKSPSSGTNIFRAGTNTTSYLQQQNAQPLI